ncbi:hypothetical protein C2G38_2224352 [Gigaspora rosea]|uniref:Uncharacterized protein n=1 Tax=Gigaspora rosea TaxID=44941 RepID=A0A397U9A2_9GLOM|nr:hypothetical protein C2G38_2224352 [Gigaspora rosea]
MTPLTTTPLTTTLLTTTLVTTTPVTTTPVTTTPLTTTPVITTPVTTTPLTMTPLTTPAKLNHYTISIVYNEIFNNQTRYSGFSVLGWTNETIIQQLLLNVSYIPMSFSLGEYKIFIFGIGSSSNSDWNYAGPDYKSSLLRTTSGKCMLYVSKIEDNFCVLKIYKDFKLKDWIEGSSPNEVWQRLNIKKYTGIQLFGLDNHEVQSLIHQYHAPTFLPKHGPIML